MGPEDRFLKVFLELFFSPRKTIYLYHIRLLSLTPPAKKWHHLTTFFPNSAFKVGSDLYDS